MAWLAVSGLNCYKHCNRGQAKSDSEAGNKNEALYATCQ